MAVDESGNNMLPAAVQRIVARVEQVARDAGSYVEEVVEGEPEVQATPVVETPVAAAPAAEDFEQKYRTLQGKYDSESQTVQQLRAQVQGMERVMAAMQPQDRHPEVKQDTRPTQPDTATPVVPADDLEAYGPELIDAVRRWAKMELSPLLSVFSDRLGSLEQKHTTVETSQRQTVVWNAREHVKAAMNSDLHLGPIWDAMNNHPQFVAWVKGQDLFSGQIRQPLLQAAFDSGQPERVKAFFNAFLSEHPGFGQDTQHQTAGNPAYQGPPARQGPSLEDFAAPGRAAVPPPPPQSNEAKRIWTQREIAQFYRACTDGKYRDNEAGRLMLEKDIIAASVEGRVRP